MLRAWPSGEGLERRIGHPDMAVRAPIGPKAVLQQNGATAKVVIIADDHQAMADRLVGLLVDRNWSSPTYGLGSPLYLAKSL